MRGVQASLPVACGKSPALRRVDGRPLHPGVLGLWMGADREGKIPRLLADMEIKPTTDLQIQGEGRYIPEAFRAGN